MKKEGGRPIDFRPVYFVENICDGRSRCAGSYMCDAFVRNTEKGKPPIRRNPKECWICGSCITASEGKESKRSLT